MKIHWNATAVYFSRNTDTATLYQLALGLE